MTYSELVKETMGYTTITTYWEDFSIADHFGKSAIIDTFKRALLNTDYKMMTELSMVLNHKIWAHYDKNKTIAEIYDDLWRKCNDTIYKTFNKEQLRYFYQVTD